MINFLGTSGAFTPAGFSRGKALANAQEAHGLAANDEKGRPGTAHERATDAKD